VVPARRPATHRRGRGPRFVTTAPESSADKTTARPAAELLPLDRTTRPEAVRRRFSSLVSWLVATARPAVVVELGPGDEASLRSTCEAILRSENGGTCAAVLLPSGSPVATEEFKRLTNEFSDRFGPAFQGYETEHAGLIALGEGMAGLLHLSLFDSDEIGVPDLAAWHELMAPGAVFVVTTTASGASSNFAAVKQRVVDTYPAVSISLGLTTEAIVAQRPIDDATPIVDMLRKAPLAVGAFLTLSGEQVELHKLLMRDAEPSDAVHAIMGRIIDQHYAERDAILSALRVYEDENARVSNELVQVRLELTQQIEAARHEREHLVAEFLDRVDELSAKVSTTASRYSAELADTNALLEAEGRKAEAYAGQAANTQSVIDDMRRSTSWRITAPVRLLSRLLARKAEAPARHEN
jgi:hypothetical protein